MDRDIEQPLTCKKGQVCYVSEITYYKYDMFYALVCKGGRENEVEREHYGSKLTSATP